MGTENKMAQAANALSLRRRRGTISRVSPAQSIDLSEKIIADPVSIPRHG